MWRFVVLALTHLHVPAVGPQCADVALGGRPCHKNVAPIPRLFQPVRLTVKGSDKRFLKGLRWFAPIACPNRFGPLAQQADKTDYPPSLRLYFLDHYGLRPPGSRSQ
jgi:hypothetical protein